jgi:uncharacterized protein with HEPN domain
MKDFRLAQDYLQDILDYMIKAEEFVEGMDYLAFQEDDKTVFAVIRALEVIGEAAKKIPTPIRRRYAAVPWKSLAGMRDKLIHDYMGISLEIVWRTIKEDIPGVKKPLIDMLETVKKEEG